MHAAGADAPLVRDMLQLTDYDEITEVLRSRSFVQAGFEATRETLARGVLTVLDGAPHLERRKLLGRMFSEQAMAAAKEQYLVPAIERSLAEVAAGPREDGIVVADLVPLTQRCLHRIAGAIAGVDGLDDPAAADRFIVQLRSVAAALTVDWSRDDPEAVTQRGLDALAAFRDEFFAPSWARRSRLIAEAGEDRSRLPLDMLTQLNAHQHAEWDDELPVRDVCSFLVGATQTTANGFILLVLRLERWFAEHPEDRARLLAAGSDLLRRAAFESLRLTVAAPARIRRATVDVRLASGREIAAGETVALFFVPANADPDRFGPHGDAFDPWREPVDTAEWGLAFGAGAHVCLGRPLVTGLRSRSDVDGTMVTMARALYGAGLELDPERPAVPDDGTWYEVYSTVPIRLTRL